ncbi:MAG: glycosyltransferase family 4 protein [Planctomycetaceae bacterium]|nr:glycosyltransferase family 4 protein [Planctomycetaceae bacterium]MBT4012457.1 glycosyltransferase family 4 protein [Planctomycetaceae bacterium]MBT4725354.1 glycosyltransferase family 4 protein [Planctomycetaceae bacterium]MBT4844054.1 glycosyltransferase family 4 protein [Planctomycetaceae bacterium]MBT5123994.1 glycosyltransferase family 4 protein [Planctomycetaceae bacterium]
MSGLRIAMITRRFWPLVGGGEMVMANLACEFKKLGAQPTILTAQWDTTWPLQIKHREIPVQRLPNPAQQGWGTYTYMDGLSRWLKHNASQYDAVLVSMLKHSAYSALGACKKTAQPIMLRIEGGGDTGDCAWHESARFGKRIRRRCQQAAAIVAPSQATYDEALDAGFKSSTLHHIPNGVAIGSGSVVDKMTVRQRLHEINHDLSCDPDTKIALFTGRLTHKKGLFELVSAWQSVAERVPNSQLWLVGEGPDRDQLFEKIKDLDLVGRVVMPGTFDDVEDFLAAADAFTLPSYAEGLSLSLLEAMAHRLPVIASDIVGNRQLIVDGTHGRLIPAQEVESLAAAIYETFANDNQQQIDAAESRVTTQFSLAGMALAHLDLLSQTVANSGES